MACEQVFEDQLWVATGASVASVTVAITPAFPDSVNRAYVIIVESIDTTAIDSSVASVTVNGVAATFQCSDGATVPVQTIYTFKQPPKGAHNVVVTFNMNVQAVVWVYELEGVDPVQVLKQLTHLAGGPATSDTLTLNGCDVNALLIQAIIAYGTTLNVTALPTAPFNSDDTRSVFGGSPNRTRASISSVTPASAVNYSPKYTISSSKTFGHAAMEVRGEPFFPQQSLCGMGF